MDGLLCGALVTRRVAARPEVLPPKGTVMQRLSAFVRRLQDAAGQGLVEYGLILALIAIVVIVALNFIGTQVSNTLSKVGASL